MGTNGATKRERIRLDDGDFKPTKGIGRNPVRRPSYEEVLKSYEANGLSPRVSQGRAITGSRMDAFRMNQPRFVREPSLENKIVKLISEGAPYATVCRFVGIKKETFEEWMDRGAAEVSRDYARIYARVCRAEAEAEMELLRGLKKHENSDWRVTAWRLERRWPANWGKRDAVRAELNLVGKVNVTHKHELSRKVVEDVSARELARQVIEGTEFGYKALPVAEDTRTDDIDDTDA